MLKNGTSVKVLDNSNAQWTKVQTSDGKQGYCSKQYLKFSSTGSGTTGSTTGSTGSTSTGSSAVTTDYLNMRQGAGTNYKVIVTIGKGVTVKVLDNSNAQWTKVQTSDGKQGYCSKQYLQFSGGSGSSTPAGGNTSSTPSTTPTTPTGTSLMGLTVSSVSIRSGAGTSYGVVCTLAGGTVVTVTDNSNASWVKIKTSSGQQGYCPRGQLIVSQQDDFSAGSGDSGTGGSSTHTITGATVTADVLRLRAQPSTTGQVLANLPNGTNLTVLDTSNASWTKVQTSAGQSGYVSAEFIKIHYSDDSSNTNTSGLSLSTSSQNVPMGKTLYIQATVTPSGSSISWTSSNTAVATVSNGYVYAASVGSAVITASSGSYHATCGVTVSNAEPVKTAYASPNIASTGETVTLTAVTDSTRDGAQFLISSPDGSSRTVDANSCTTETKLDTTVKIWRATTTFNSAGTYAFTAYSSVNGKMSSSGYTTNAYVSAQQNFTTTTNEDRRISDQMISLIATWEGYRATVYADQLTSNQVPTIGYGCTFGANAIFYNNMTETEAWSMLVNKINNSSYTSELNKMIHSNNFLMNQNQADCLISFAYNVGAGYFNSSTEPDFKRIMENAVVPPDFSGGSVAATVTMATSLMGAPSTGGNQICSVANGTSVTVTGSSFSDTRDGWYQVTLSDGSQGWLNSGYVSLSNAASLVHDLNYTNAYAFGTELIRWNQAGGKFYAGLFYRRLGEANAYNYGDYSAARSNKYNYSYPSAAAGLS